MSCPTVVALAAAALLSAAPLAHAQLRPSFGVAAGLSAPTNDLGRTADAGYNLGAHVQLGAPLMPIGVRLEGALSSFNAQGLTSNELRITSGTANAVVSLGTIGASPYLIGGVGIYGRKYTGGLVTDTKSVGGVNGGAGVRFPLGGLSTFIEARYHRMLGNATDLTNLSYVPVTFGIGF